MRVVLYDHETMEPITVLHLPSWMTSRLADGERLRVPMVPTFRMLRQDEASGSIGPLPKSSVTIWFEKFIRHGRVHWFAFTGEGEDALLCKAVFLPGQQREVQSREQIAFVRGLLGMFEKS
jgi:hypothetical protein